jgi:hypothetical protein
MIATAKGHEGVVNKLLNKGAKLGQVPGLEWSRR